MKYRVERRDGRSYTIGTNNILSAALAIERVGMFNITEVVKITEESEEQ